MKIFVLTTSTGDDRVFSTKRAAEQYAKAHYDREWPWDFACASGDVDSGKPMTEVCIDKALKRGEFA